jgi:micrococcal nuclease
MKFKLCFFCLFLFVFSDAFCQQIFTGKVIKIVDGDTFDMLIKNNTTIRVRMNGIDCPEKKQAFYSNSKKTLSVYIFGKNVKVISTSKDKYKRILGVVFLNKKNVNLQMVANGFAWHFKKYSSDIILAKAEINAKSKKLGLWQLPNPISPWDFRKTK